MEDEILISVSFRVPQNDRKALVERLIPLMRVAIETGGDTVHVSLQPYRPDEE